MKDVPKRQKTSPINPDSISPKFGSVKCCYFEQNRYKSSSCIFLHTRTECDYFKNNETCPEGDKCQKVKVWNKKQKADLQ